MTDQQILELWRKIAFNPNDDADVPAIVQFARALLRERPNVHGWTPMDPPGRRHYQD